jgi:hypothetical protein
VVGEASEMRWRGRTGAEVLPINHLPRLQSYAGARLYHSVARWSVCFHVRFAPFHRQCAQITMELLELTTAWVRMKDSWKLDMRKHEIETRHSQCCGHGDRGAMEVGLN